MWNLLYLEKIKLRQSAVEYAIKHDNNAKVARKDHTTRQQIARWRSRYDGTAQSLLEKSRRSLHHPNEHKKEELEFIRKMYKRYNRDRLAEDYVQCQRRGYTLSYGTMKKMIKKFQLTEKKERILRVNGHQYQQLIQEKKYKSTLNMFLNTV